MGGVTGKPVTTVPDFVSNGSVTPLDVFKETLSQCLRGDKSRYFSAET